MAKRAEKVKFERHPHVSLVPFILETTSRPGYHAKKFVSNLKKDADNPPLAIRDAWSAIQSVLHSATGTSTVPLPFYAQVQLISTASAGTLLFCLLSLSCEPVPPMRECCSADMQTSTTSLVSLEHLSLPVLRKYHFF